MASAREMLRETLDSLNDAEVLRALELVRHLRSTQQGSGLLNALAANPDVHPPVAPEGCRPTVEPIEVEGPPVSRQLVEARR
ncbi:MAG: hypothetical protein AAB225_21380 [Acidobacteriota bacterium]